MDNAMQTAAPRYLADGSIAYAACGADPVIVLGKIASKGESIVIDGKVVTAREDWYLCRNYWRRAVQVSRSSLRKAYKYTGQRFEKYTEADGRAFLRRIEIADKAGK